MASSLGDRLSDLPDDIIHHIFSFIDTKFCVRASVLSKRWKRMWASLPNLNFDGCDGRPDPIFFQCFVLRVLAGRDHNIPCNLRLHVRKIDPDSSFFEKILAYLESHNVQSFSISFEQFSCVNYEDFSTSFSRSQCLKTLELTNYYRVPSQSDYQPTWTNLSLNDCSFKELSRSIHPFASCVNLKKLHLHNCSFSGRTVLNISCPQLVNLILSDLDVHTRDPVDDTFKLKILAPKLLSFSLKLKRPLDFSILHLPVLENADIRIHSPNNFKILSFRRLIRIFRGLHHAQSVKICSKIIEMLTFIPGALEEHSCPFSRLKSLTMTCRGSSDYIPATVMAYFLSNSNKSVENIQD